MPMRSDAPETTDEDIIARAIDTVAWAPTAWFDPRVGLAAGVVLADVQEARQAKARAKAREVLEELAAAGRKIGPA